MLSFYDNFSKILKINEDNEIQNINDENKIRINGQKELMDRVKSESVNKVKE